MDRENLLERFRRKYKDPANFTTINSNSLNYIRNIVEGKFPITEERDKPGHMTEAPTAGDAMSRKELVQEYQHMMHTQRPGAEFEGELHVVTDKPSMPGSRNEVREEVMENPFMDFTEYELGEELEINLKKLFEDKANEIGKAYDRRKKQTPETPLIVESIASIETNELIHELKKLAQEEPAPPMGEEAPAGGEDASGDVGLDLSGLDLGGLGEGGGGLDLPGLDLGGLGGPKPTEEKKPKVLVDINPSILEALPEQDKRLLVFSVNKFKELLARDLPELTISEIKSTLSLIERILEKAKENVTYQELGFKSVERSNTQIENVNRYATLKKVADSSAHYFMDKLTLELLKMGVKPSYVSVLETDIPYTKMIVFYDIPNYKNPNQVDERITRVPFKVVYNALEDRPEYIETIGGIKLDFTKDSLDNLITYYSGENIDFYYGYYNPQFMKKKADTERNIAKRLKEISESKERLEFARKFFSRSGIIPLSETLREFVIVSEDGNSGFYEAADVNETVWLTPEELEEAKKLIEKIRYGE